MEVNQLLDRTVASKRKNVTEICESVRKLNQLVLAILIGFEYAVIKIQVVLILLSLDNCIHVTDFLFIRHEYVHVHCNGNEIVILGGNAGYKVVPIEHGNMNVIETHRCIALYNYHWVNN